MKSRRLGKLLRWLVAIVCLPAMAEKPLKICETKGNAEAICGLPTPEDIEPLPDGRHLLLSSYGGLKGESKSPLNVLDTRSLKLAPIVIVSQDKPKVRWDDSVCPTPPAQVFSSHGIHLGRRRDGAWQLLAVNHDRESVEMFELIFIHKVPELAWRGCVVLPLGSCLNDVVALPDGGFLVSHMITLGDSPASEIVKLNNRNGPSGYVLRWRPGLGVDKLPGSAGNLTNGLAVSADRRSVFIVETGSQDVRRIAYDSGETTGHAAAFGDNLSWTKDGHLLTAGVTTVPDNCVTRVGVCRPPFEVRAIAADTMTSELIFRSNGSPPGGTVAVIQGDYLYLGGLMGDQLTRVRVAKNRKLKH
jgi:hypothetical protein